MIEQEMRDTTVPTLNTLEELSTYIDSLIKQDHDYGTAVYAMSMAAVAAFNHVAHQLGVSGFQAGCADLDVLRRNRHLKGPFMIIDASDMLYPQYNLRDRLEEILEKWKPWAAEEARRLLDNESKYTHPDVLEHWKRLVND